MLYSSANYKDMESLPLYCKLNKVIKKVTVCCVKLSRVLWVVSQFSCIHCRFLENKYICSCSYKMNIVGS